MIKCLAFDCFGTVFDMAGVSQDEIRDYVRHVRQNDFTPYNFPDSWWNLQLHHDAATGIKLLQQDGFVCSTLSNGDAKLLRHVSERGGIYWDHIVDLAAHKVYKPHLDAYKTVQKDLGFLPEETMMVTANPTFGDVEGASALGMFPQVIRQEEGDIKDIIDLANFLRRGR